MRRTLFALALTAATPAAAEDARVIAAEARDDGMTWRFSVTVESADTGWEKYADAWEVRAPDGTRLGLRELLHPHVDEQPFTRSLSGVAVPEGVDRVLIRACDTATGWGEDFALELPR